jgi:hypothetical protein
MSGAEIIPFPTKKSSPASVTTLRPQVRHGHPDNRFVFIRISNPKQTPDERAIDIMWAWTRVCLPPMITRSILTLQPGVSIRFQDAFSARIIIARREADDLLFEFETGKDKRPSKHISMLPRAIFGLKATILLQRPRPIHNP